MSGPGDETSSWRSRIILGCHYLVITAVVVGAIGVAGELVVWPLLTSTLGPTAYVFAAHPTSESARWRNAVLGHSVALASGLAALAAFGLWNEPSAGRNGYATLAQVGASAAAVGVTLLLLELMKSHHAPAAATALLITTGLARPGKPLAGLAVGLAVVLVAAPLATQLLFRRTRPQRVEHTGPTS